MISAAAFAALKETPGVLHELAGEDLRAANTLPLLSKLRKKYPPELAGAALETCRLRKRGAEKFTRAGEMFFTEESLQQATAQPLAEYHAERFAPFARVADLGCGIGGDSLALGQRSAVLGVDVNPLRLRMARHNAAVYGASAAFIQANLADALPFKDIPAAFCDPARRAEGRRVFSVRQYSPTLEHILNWKFEAVLVKLSPGVQLEELADFPGGIEFLSYDGSLRESLLCMGAFAFRGLRAVRLPEREILVSSGCAPPSVVHSPKRYLAEPDPALIRSGLFGELLEALNLDAYRIHEQIAYLTSDTPLPTPWLRWWEIHDWMPFHLKRLRKHLRTAGVGRVTVKKRGSPIQPQELQAMLKLKTGSRHVILFVTQLVDQPVVFIHFVD